MKNNIAILKQMALSRNVEESIQGIEHLVNLVNEILESILKSLELSNDRFVIVEKISPIFDDYIMELKKKVAGRDKDLGFWAAALIAHYGIQYHEAEKKLTDEILFGTLSNAYTATTILCRQRNLNVKSVILERLKDSTLSEESRAFFEEKLQEIRR